MAGWTVDAAGARAVDGLLGIIALALFVAVPIWALASSLALPRGGDWVDGSADVDALMGDSAGEGDGGAD